MTFSNWLTLGRILLIPVFMALLLSDVPQGVYLSALVFVVAAITDGIDGYVARVRKETSLLGEVLDPFADKLLISAALVSLVELGRLSAWVAMVIIAREFMVSGLRVVAIGLGKRISASSLGKMKTVFQIIAVVAWVLLPHKSIIDKDTFYWGGIVLMGMALVLTIYSAIDYFRLSFSLINEAGRRGVI